MKKHLAGWMAIAVLSFYGHFAAATSASAFTISNGATDVGVVDFFLDSAVVNSGDQAELDWVNGYLITNGYIETRYTSMVKYNSENMLSEDTDTFVPGIWNWRYVDGSSTVVAQNLQGTPEYFFIKTGKNITPDDKKDTTPDHFLFKNDANLNWSVVDLSRFGNSYELSGVGVLSHVGEFGGATSVPEPGTMMLLGAGLLGFAVYGKRRMNKKE